MHMSGGEIQFAARIIDATKFRWLIDYSGVQDSDIAAFIHKDYSSEDKRSLDSRTITITVDMINMNER